MATAALSLFPSPSLRNKSSLKGGLHHGQRSAKEPDFEMVKMSDSTQGIVIAIQETPTPNHEEKTSVEPRSSSPSPEHYNLPSVVLSASPKPQVSSEQSPSSTTPQRAISQSQPRMQTTSKSSSPIYGSPSRTRAPSPLQLEGSPRSRASSPTLVRKGSNASTRTATHSPVMRSMFPRYDPSVPLNRQQYQPSAQSGRVSSDIPEHIYSPSLHPQQNTRSTRPSAPTLVIPTSSGTAPILQNVISEPTTATFSAPDELLPLWDIANGQGRDGANDVFKIELGCDSLNNDSESIYFSSSSQSLYTLSASATTLAISRTHPLHPAPTIQICQTNLFTPTATSPLVATIFPKLAELMALDQSSSIAVAHRLDRQTSFDLQSEAISRAQQNEASNLLWDSDSGKYYLIHPTLLDNASTTFPIEITPSALNPEQIVISAPETNGTTPLLNLSLATRTLTINPGPVTALPSLYTLDTLVAALLTLLLHLHRSSSTHLPSLTQTRNAHPIAPTFPPPPTLLTLASRPKRSRKRTLSTWSRSVFSRRQEPDLEARHPDPVETTLVTQTGNPNPNPKTATETEAKHDWTFQPLVDTDDENLPAAARAVVGTLYWGFQVFVWAVGVLVNLLAAGVAGVGRLAKGA